MKSEKDLPPTDYQEFTKTELAKSEERIAKFWAENDIFQKSMQKDAPSGDYVVYEGPPTANGRPGIHHLESRAFKDAIPRYKTMQGYHVSRRAGWDTHGLPVELEVEKQLGFSGKPDIEKYGIAEFNDRCRESVMTYVDEWQAFTDRIGYWVDHESAYYTFTPGYMESVWWVFAQSHKNGLLYKDYKVLPWCSRCGTALSSHELAQGYKDVKDLSVTAKFELVDELGTFVLAWTTTPWTLPGNIALAVGNDIDYVRVSAQGEFYIVAKKLVKKVFATAKIEDYKIVGEMKGSELVGQAYKPLYPYLGDLAAAEKLENLENAYQIYPADFVTIDDGTGVVHTAVMYGQDDFELGNQLGLPKFHMVDPEGHFIPGTDFLAGRFVKDEAVAVDIIRDLALRDSGSLLFSKEKYEHSYPHCWRCKTPLIYYARDSWYIRMSDLSAKLLENNQKINWEPDYIKEGRMGEWLRGVKDWAVSRERYWGTPLPIWESEDGDLIVVDSIATLQRHAKSGNNNYFLTRHGESESNIAGVISAGELQSTHPLTENGQEQAKQKALNLKAVKIDLIVASPFLRTSQTAEIIAQELGLNPEDILYKDGLRDYCPGGDLIGTTWEDFHNTWSKEDQFFKSNDAEGESRKEAISRAVLSIQELEREHKGKNVLIVSHRWIINGLDGFDDGIIDSGMIDRIREGYGRDDKYYQMNWKQLPIDNNGELNLHRPYIDDVVLEKDGKEYRRVKEVMDVWFDSGSMPWAQNHFPFSTDAKEIGKEPSYPADFISEGIDQTRGWFYVLQAIAGFMGKTEAPYKNVICLGLINDADGKKMSKSLGNAPNPWELIAKYGADALRFWMYSVNQPGETKNFDEKTVDEIVKKVFNLLRNSASFYQMFADFEHVADPTKSPSVLDQWLLARLSSTVQVVTDNMDDYKLLESTRAIRELIGDLSQWYIRRSRDRFKGANADDRSYALATTRHTLQTIAQLLAPFAPYLAEEIWQQLSGVSAESVHLSIWPVVENLNTKLESDMDAVRELSSIGLALRADAGVNTRQPLSSFTHDKLKLSKELNEVLADELNVKEIKSGKVVELDLDLTTELIDEGDFRELLRAVQSLRKKHDLVPSDPINLLVISNGVTQQESKIENWSDDLQSQAQVMVINFSNLVGDNESNNLKIVKLSNQTIKVEINKA